MSLEHDAQLERLIEALNKLVEGFKLHELLREDLSNHFAALIQQHTVWINQKMADQRNELMTYMKEERAWVDRRVGEAKPDPLYERHVNAVEKAADAADRLANEVDEGDAWKHPKRGE